MVRKATTSAIINIAATRQMLHERILAGVQETARRAHDRARADAPVRKVFRYGRTKAGLRIQGRQETRTLNLEEALSESLSRRRLGLPSAFSTDAAGRRRRNSQPLVRTAQLSDTYRARDRANSGSERDLGRRGIQRAEALVDDRGRQFDVRPLAEPRLFDPEAQSDLSARGRYELKRAKGETLGGALRRSIKLHNASNGTVMTAHITAGNKDVDYAAYVEFGTRRSRAQPFMRPAKAQAREQFPDILRLALRGADLTGGSRR
jgi:HK97 gp10 family phage protein